MPPPRAFAPGLAARKPKVNPYDPEGREVPINDYSYMKEKESVEVSGTWSTIDSENNTRQWDQQFEQEQLAKNKASPDDNTTSSFRVAPKDPSVRWAGEQIAGGEGERGTNEVDNRFENPDLDVDPEVRERFVDVRNIMREDERPLSVFEQRNKAILFQTPTAPIKVVIGGQIITTVTPKIDRRAELRDRDGRYIDGKDRGLMPKRYEEERKRRMEERDEQMEQATKERREWFALSPEDRERKLQKAARNKALVALLGAGVDKARTDDIYTYEGIPDVYTRKVDPKAISKWSESNASRSGTSTTDMSREASSFEPEDDRLLAQGVGLQIAGNTQVVFSHKTNDLHTPRPPSRRQSSFRFNGELTSKRHDLFSAQYLNSYPAHSRRSDSTVRGIASSGGRPGPIDSSIGDRSVASASSTNTRTTPFAPDQDLDLAPLFDIPKKEDGYTGDLAVAGMEKYDMIKAVCSRRGRVVVVNLHEPVHYGSSAIAQRVFGGALQAIQYFPAERAALVVFLYPSEAAAFIRHVQKCRENDAHAYRSLQISAEWYHGSEDKAVYPAQRHLLAAAVVENACRVLLINHISVKTTTAEFAHDMKLFEKVLVKVAIVTPSKRYVQLKEGNQGIIELSTIADAKQLMERFQSGRVTGYERCTVEWLNDSCDRAPGRQQFCDCPHCKHLG